MIGRLEGLIQYDSYELHRKQGMLATISQPAPAGMAWAANGNLLPKECITSAHRAELEEEIRVLKARKKLFAGFLARVQAEPDRNWYLTWDEELVERREQMND